MTCVTPSPESITVPVSVRSDACFDVHEAASASTACIQNHTTAAQYSKCAYMQVYSCTDILSDFSDINNANMKDLGQHKLPTNI